MDSLLSVAEHLAQQAKLRPPDIADAYGRTAFNRYYYAAFLSTRELLIHVERSWSQPRHNNIPTLLKKTLVERLRTDVNRLRTKGVFTDGKAKSVLNKAISSATEMASILETAYIARVTADYEPEQKVVFEASTFRLATYTEAEARHWPTRINRHKGIILNVMKEIGRV